MEHIGLMKFIIAILFALSARSEVPHLGVISQGSSMKIAWPDRSDVVSLEIIFLPTLPPTNAIVLVTTNRVLHLVDLPPELPEGRILLKTCWICLGEITSGYRDGTIDLWRQMPEPPILAVTAPEEAGPGRKVEPQTGAAASDVPARRENGKVDHMVHTPLIVPPSAFAVPGALRSQQMKPAAQRQIEFYNEGGQKGRTNDFNRR